MAESEKKAMPAALAPKVPRPTPARPSSSMRPPPLPPARPPPSSPSAQDEGPISVPSAAMVTADTDIINAGRSGPADPRATDHSLPRIGDRVGKYVVERLIGSGGMGLVVAARHEALGELVAIKLLRPKAAGDKVHSERFAREARAIIKIKSEHVVRVLDAGTLEDSGSPYIVMEYLVGRDLAAILRAEGPPPTSRAADLMLQVCEAVASAHAVGVVHRDLKPSNFFVTERADGTTLVKVLDFGISKAMGQEGVVDPNLTETQAVFGSPTYMSPEQIRSAKHVDHRSDIWSLGVGLFELLTGKLPFAADNVAGLLASIVADPPFFPHAFAPDLPPELEALLLACLQKDPKQRVQSVVELACRLAPFATQDVETHTLLERIQRLGARGSGPALPGDPSTTTGPKLPLASTPPLVAPPPSGQRSGAPDAARASGVSFGSTGVDLSEAPPPHSDRGVFTGIGIGLGVALLLIVGGVGAYFGARRGPSVVTSTAPEIAPAALPATAPQLATSPPGSAYAAPPSTVTVAPAESVEPAASTKPAASTAGKKIVKHGAKASPGSPTATPSALDPTSDRF